MPSLVKVLGSFWSES